MPNGTEAPWWRGKRGEGYVAVQVLLLGLLLLGPRTLPGLPAWRGRGASVASWLGIALMLAGGALLGASSIRLGRNLTPLPHPRDHSILVQSGPYRLVRHPIYAGVLALALGWALWVRGSLTLAFAGLLWVLFEFKADREELWLTEKFPEYENYRQKVAKLLPFVH